MRRAVDRQQSNAARGEAVPDRRRALRRFAIVAGATIFAIVSSAAARAAGCGSMPGDDMAKATVRAAMEMQCPCAAATSRGAYIRCAKGVVNRAVLDGVLPAYCASTVKKCATRSTCGRPPGWVTCCRTTATGRTTCKVKSSAAKCTAPSGAEVLDVIAGLPTVGALGVSGNIDLTTLLAP